ncbi:MAG: hypothetical protein J6X55_09685 [Victivallales bacterium]|nr:hypothetical protein [Victivallales bacterium]
MTTRTIVFTLICAAIGMQAQLCSYVVPKATAPIVIDGKLDETDWKKAPLIDDFQPWGNGSKAELTPTRVWIAQEKDALCIAAECMEEFPNALLAKATHDGPTWNDDHLEFFFDPAGERKGFVQIVVNCKGTVSDLSVVKKDGRGISDFGWESEAEVKTTIGQDRWNMEMRIPFANLPQSTPGMDWTFHVARGRYTMVTQNMTSLKSPIKGFHEVEAFDFLCGIKGEPTGILTVTQDFGTTNEGKNIASITLKNTSDTPKTITVTMEITGDDGQPKPFAVTAPLPPTVTKTIHVPWVCSRAAEGKSMTMKVEMDGKRIQAFSALVNKVHPFIGPLATNVLFFDDRTPAVVDFNVNAILDSPMTVFWELWPHDGAVVPLISGQTAVQAREMRIRIYTTFLSPGLYTLRRYLFDDATGKRIVVNDAEVVLIHSPWN